MAIKNSVNVRVPNRSGFDKGYKNILTTKVGTITPLACKYVMPGAKGHIRIPISACLPPLASDTFMRCSLKVEAFLVPLRLLYGGFESWQTGTKFYNSSTSSYTTAEIPVLEVADTDWTTYSQYFGPGSLLDYLDFRPDGYGSLVSGSVTRFNLFPILCYHRVYDDWYRNAKIQQPIFTPPIYGTAGTNASFLPYIANANILRFRAFYGFNNGHILGALHQRNWGDDYFSIATTQAQVGNPVSIASASSFTIAALRTGNSLQQFAERSNLTSPRLQDYNYAHFGASLSSGVAQRSILLGSASYDVYSKGVEANAPSSATNNPFTSVGARYGNAFASGADFSCSYEANEQSMLLINATLVPEANYGSGISHEFLILNGAGAQVDLPDPLLENIGNEPIYSSELNGFISTVPQPGAPGSVFGYVPRNTWYKSNHNQVHGLLRSGQSLDSFVAQRTFTGATSIGSSFLEIPTTALDNVTAVTADLSNYGCWIDSYIDIKESCPLSESAMPSLQDPSYEHGHNVNVKFNGSKL